MWPPNRKHPQIENVPPLHSERKRRAGNRAEGVALIAQPVDSAPRFPSPPGNSPGVSQTNKRAPGHFLPLRAWAALRQFHKAAAKDVGRSARTALRLDTTATGEWMVLQPGSAGLGFYQTGNLRPAFPVLLTSCRSRLPTRASHRRASLHLFGGRRGQLVRNEQTATRNDQCVRAHYTTQPSCGQIPTSRISLTS